eukprot:scaffold66010_cov21-Tisochrysis_lutea.AAC.1
MSSTINWPPVLGKGSQMRAVLEGSGCAMMQGVSTPRKSQHRMILQAWILIKPASFPIGEPHLPRRGMRNA